MFSANNGADHVNDVAPKFLMSTERHTNAHSAAAEATSQKYQSLFPEVSPISSLELLHESFSPMPSMSSSTISNPHWRLHGRDVLLVDVRTRPEREVSMIAGAIPLDEFRENVLPSLLSNKNNDEFAMPSESSSLHKNVNNEKQKDNDSDTISPHSSRPGTIAMYCTIGFRSGMEARKLQREYPSLFGHWGDDDDGGGNNVNNLQERESASIRIGNLDGILTFANATLECSEIGPKQSITPSSNNNKHADLEENSQSLLINPVTNQPTHRVHVYGPSWKQYLSPTRYEAIVFSKVEFAWRGLLVLGQSCCLSCNGCRK
mmetsp:Transcript_18486/g.33975  ORF Transcript_18486/g.33975 Transcript_18486/m.33975 type:complete len:318 (+) Transcript_18486:54-1007(+)